MMDIGFKLNQIKRKSSNTPRANRLAPYRGKLDRHIVLPYIFRRHLM